VRRHRPSVPLSSLTRSSDATRPRRAHAVGHWRRRRTYGLQRSACLSHGASNVNSSRSPGQRGLAQLHEVFPALVIGHGAVRLLPTVGVVARVRVLDCLCLTFLCGHTAAQRETLLATAALSLPSSLRTIETCSGRRDGRVRGKRRGWTPGFFVLPFRHNNLESTSSGAYTTY